MDKVKPILLNFLIATSVILVMSTVYSVISLLNTGEEIKQYKADYSKIHSVEYGMFNSQIWADKISLVIDEKIDEFEFTSQSRTEIQTYVESILDKLLVEADVMLRARNKGNRGWVNSMLGSTKQIITDSLIDLQEIRKRVPEFTKAIIHELEKPTNQQFIKETLRKKLHSLTADNFMPTDMSGYNAIVNKYSETKDYKEATKNLDAQLNAIHQKLNSQTNFILILVSLTIVVVLLQGFALNYLSLAVLSISSVSLLLPGILLPMLDIEAKISKLDFLILNKHVEFTDQILFFQSKSISNLVSLLMESDDGKMILVGVLLTTFSIIFPTLKLIASHIYYFGVDAIRNNFLVKFFAINSTKWSMADVMVVSIFMSYLGLDGVVDSELSYINSRVENINIITTNGTQLEVGFYLFLGFVITSFILSLLLSNSKRNIETTKED